MSQHNLPAEVRTRAGLTRRKNPGRRDVAAELRELSLFMPASVVPVTPKKQPPIKTRGFIAEWFKASRPDADPENVGYKAVQAQRRHDRAATGSTAVAEQRAAEFANRKARKEAARAQRCAP